MEEEIKQSFARYGESLIKGDHKKTVDFIYPKLFNFIPKETIVNGLKASLKNQPAKIVLDDFKIASIEGSHNVDENSYTRFVSTSTMEMIFPQPAEKDKDDEGEENEITGADFTYEILVGKYGEDNVEYDKESGVIRATVISTLLAIKEDGKCYFLDLKPQLMGLYKKFLPGVVVDDLAGLFHEELEDKSLDVVRKKKDRKTKDVGQKVRTSGNVKHIYLAGWEAYFNGDQQCENFMATQITTKATVEKLHSGIELVFENNKLAKAWDYADGKKQERPLSTAEIGLAYKDFPVNKFYKLSWSARGKHQLGGEVPNEFALPKSKCIVPFQYLGYINNEDPGFKWLPFKVHLACPIYLNVQNVFLDYSDPLNPAVINADEINDADTSYDELNRDFEIVFEPMKFNFVEAVTFSSTGHAGIPNWIQDPAIPICPKSGKRMKFLCQLNGGVRTLRTNVKTTDTYSRHYFDELNFWGDGDLFVFFEPTSKVACYFIQNT